MVRNRLNCKQVHYQQTAQLPNVKAHLYVSATVRSHLQGLSILKALLYRVPIVNDKCIIPLRP